MYFSFNEVYKKRLYDVLNEINLDVRLASDGQTIFLNGEDVTNLIRTPEISMAASAVSAVPEVRSKLVDMQREMAKALGREMQRVLE